MEKTTLQYLDWKESFFYKHLIVRHESDDDTFEKDHLIRSDDFDFLMKTIKGFRSRKPTCKDSELYQMLPPMMRKVNATICLILKEILGEENYKLEYDQMLTRNPFVVTSAPRGWDNKACRVFTLENHLARVKELKLFRKDVITFLEVVH